MAIFDTILFIILGCFVVFGFWFGLIHAFGALFGILIGATVASRYFEYIADFIHQFSGGSLNALKVFVFIILFILINRLAGFIFYIMEDVFNLLKIIPFLSSINRLGGTIFGFLEGGLVIGLSLYFASIHPFSLWLSEMILSKSEIARYFLNAAIILMPLLPETIKELQARLPDFSVK